MGMRLVQYLDALLVSSVLFPALVSLSIVDVDATGAYQCLSRTQGCIGAVHSKKASRRDRVLDRNLLDLTPSTCAVNDPPPLPTIHLFLRILLPLLCYKFINPCM
jgi:hypothetical protein